MTSIFSNTLPYDSMDKDIKYLSREFLTGGISMPDIQRRPRNLDLETKNLIKSEKKDNDGWSLSYKEEFISSIIEGLSIPSITLAEEKDGTCKLYDGGHRLRCLAQFIHNCFGVQVGNTYYMYNIPLTEEEDKIIKRRKLEECNKCLPITNTTILSDYDRRKFNNKTIRTVIYSNCNEETMINIFNKLNNQAPLSPGEKIFAGSNKIHKFIRSIRNDNLNNFKSYVELRTLHRYTDVVCTAGLFNLLFIPGGDPEPKITIAALDKCSLATWEAEMEQYTNIFINILNDIFDIINKCIEIRNGQKMENIGFDSSKDKCKLYLFYTLGVIVLKKYKSNAVGMSDIINVLNSIDNITFATYLLQFSQLTIENQYMNIYQRNTTSPTNTEHIIVDGVNNPNKSLCIKERALALTTYIHEEMENSE